MPPQFEVRGVMRSDVGFQISSAKVLLGFCSIRLTKDWTKMCSVQGFYMGKGIRIDRWEQGTSLQGAFVTFDRVTDP